LAEYDILSLSLTRATNSFNIGVYTTAKQRSEEEFDAAHPKEEIIYPTFS
jgi:hypothetical protein